MAPTLRHADLFAGTGGFTVALRGISEPALYCDCDPEVSEYLTAAFAAGELPAAPLVPDVRDVRGEHGPVDIVTAGFPCLGFSVAGLRLGLRDERSGLVRSAVAAATTLRADHVLLENSPEVATRPDDLREICELLVAAGFSNVRWTVVSAADVGAPHLRRRWFCMASRPGSSVGDVSGAPPLAERWDPDCCPPPMRQTGLSLADVAAVRMLGNSLVPQAARAALLHLAPQRAPTQHCPEPSQDGAYVDGRFARAPAFVPPCPASDARVVLDPTWYVDPGLSRRKNTKVVSRAVERPISRRRWPTPRHGPLSHSHVLTERASWDLCTAARFCSSVHGRATERPGIAARVSPEFVRYLMRGK